MSLSTGYVSNSVTDKKADEVRMVLRGGVVKEAVAIPPLEPSPERVPVTEAHRKGVVDPMSAALIPVAGKGDVLAPEACKRKLAIFDGRQRVDIDLVYKRMDQVKADKGYQGPVVVCTVLYQPGRRASARARRHQVPDRAARHGNVAGADQRHARAGAVPLLGADPVRARRAAGELFRRQPAAAGAGAAAPAQGFTATPVHATTQ